MAQKRAWGRFGAGAIFGWAGEFLKEKSHSHGILLIDQSCYFLDGSVVALTR